MPKLTVEPMVDGVTPASGEEFNKRFSAITEVVNNLDSSNISQEGLGTEAISKTILESVYPIGSIYSNGINNTNPAQLLGFGTWVPHNVGRVSVGFDGSQTEFNAVGKQGGEKTVSLTSAQNGPHTHGVNDPGHRHSYTKSSRLEKPIHGAADWQHGFNDGGSTSNTGTSSTNISIQSSGSGSPHQNLQPYSVDYCWMRTA